MKSIRRFGFIVMASLALTCCLVSRSIAQSSEVQELNKLIISLYQQGKYAEAISLAQRLLAILEKALGPNHLLVATELNNVAELYHAEGRYAPAEPLLKRALTIEERALGPDHPDVARTLNNLAGLYGAEGRYADAEPLYRRTLAIYEKTLGPDQPRVASALNNLASLYSDEGRYADAEPLLKRALAIWEKALGPEHPNVAVTLNNLAALYREQGRYVEAEPLVKRALAIYEKALGPDHPDVAQALNNLATLYSDEGRYASAEPLHKRALAIWEKAIGPEHPNVAVTLNNLAELYREQGRYADAEPLYKRSLAIREKMLGPDHPDVAASLHSLALLYWLQGRYADAEPLYNRSLAIREKALGPDHPQVAEALDGLAATYRQEGRDAEAAPLLTRSLTIFEKALGPAHPKVAQSVNNLAAIYHDEGRDPDAESLLRRALAIGEKALGPDHPQVARAINNLAALYQEQGRYAEAEPLFKRALAIYEKALGPDHPDVASALDNLAELYSEQDRYAEALPLVRGTIDKKTAKTWAALPILFGALGAKLVTADEAIDDGLNVVQRASQTSAGEALNALAVRFSAGNGRLAELVRKDQDLAGEAASLEKAIVAAVSKEPSKRDTAAEQRIRDRIATIVKERTDLQTVFTREFPDYAALSKPQPLTFNDIQALLADDEALIVVDLGVKKGYVWAITRSAADWKELAVSAGEVSKRVSALLALLKSHGVTRFDTQESFELYQKLLGPVEDTLRDKPRLSFVLNGALTSLPPQLLVTRDSAGKELKDADWLLRAHAVTVLPSIASLKVLRGRSAAEAPKPLVGFAAPIFNPSPLQLAESTRAIADLTATRGIRGTVADLAELEKALPALPETATELKRVAASVYADPASLFMGADATETRVKQEKLDQYRIVYFATHGLLAGDVGEFAKLNAEPALVLTLPEHPTAFDDGLLTASEVAQLKLNADWVVLSACNTASAEKPGAEALSGLARAFFYAGARSLVVSNWEVNSDSAVTLMTGTFAALAADPKLSHAEALRKSMLAMIENPQQPDWVDPKYWAPFIVVGEPAKP